MILLGRAMICCRLSIQTTGHSLAAICDAIFDRGTL